MVPMTITPEATEHASIRCDLVANIEDPLKLSVEALRVDNSSFYE